MSRPRIVFSYPSSEDSQSPPEKRAKQESWEKRLNRLETGDESDCKIMKKFGTQSHFQEDERDQINISNYEYALVSELVKYMYSFKVNISTENVEDLLKISDEYEVARLFEKAQKFIVDRIDTENVIDCLILSEYITTAKLLKSTSIDYILDHYFELETESWKKLSWELLREILHHKMLNEQKK